MPLRNEFSANTLRRLVGLCGSRFAAAHPHRRTPAMGADGDDDTGFADAQPEEPQLMPMLNHSVEVDDDAAEPPQPESGASSSHAHRRLLDDGAAAALNQSDDPEDPSQRLLRRGVSEPSLLSPPPSPATPRNASVRGCGALLGTLAHFVFIEGSGLVLLAFGQLALLTAAWQRGGGDGGSESDDEEGSLGLGLVEWWIGVPFGLRPAAGTTLAVAAVGVECWLCIALLIWAACLLRRVGTADHGDGAYVSFVIEFKDGAVHSLTAWAGLLSSLVCAAVSVLYVLEQKQKKTAPAGMAESNPATPTAPELCVLFVLYTGLRVLDQSGGATAFAVDISSDALHRATFSKRALWYYGGCAEVVRQLGLTIAHGELRDGLVTSGGYSLDNLNRRPGQVILSAKRAASDMEQQGGLDESCEAEAAPLMATVSRTISGQGAHKPYKYLSGQGAHKLYKYLSVPGARWRDMDECQVYSQSGGTWSDAIVSQISVPEMGRPGEKAGGTVTLRYRTAQGREMVKTLAQESPLIRPRRTTDTSAPPRTPDPDGHAGGATEGARRPKVTFSEGKSPGPGGT